MVEGVETVHRFFRHWQSTGRVGIGGGCRRNLESLVRDAAPQAASVRREECRDRLRVGVAEGRQDGNTGRRPRHRAAEARAVRSPPGYLRPQPPTGHGLGLTAVLAHVKLL